jgi:hypothetical protein
MISQCEWYIKNKLGTSARGLIVLDTKDIYQENIDDIILHHRYGVPKAHRAKWITEFANPVDSQRNPMIQLSDLVCFLTRKFLEIDKGYHDEYPSEVKRIYRDFYKKIHGQRISVKLPYTEDISRPFRHQGQITDTCCIARQRFATTAY